MKKSAWISREKKMRHVKIINDKIYLVSKLNPSPTPQLNPFHFLIQLITRWRDPQVTVI